MRRHVSTTVDSQLSALTAYELNMDIFTTRNTSTGVYVRNPALWTNCDLTGSTANNWGGIAITPDIVIYSNHAHASVGSTIHFVTSANTTITRTITAGQAAPGYTPYWPDWWIAKLNQPLPATIKPAKFLPANWKSYIPDHENYNYMRMPTIGLNQFRDATVQDCWFVDNNTAKSMTTTLSPVNSKRLAFYKNKIGGDSSSPLILPINREPVLLTVWTFGGSGSGTSLTSQISAISAAMVSLGSAYTIQTISLSAFASY